MQHRFGFDEFLRSYLESIDDLESTVRIYPSDLSESVIFTPRLEKELIPFLTSRNAEFIIANRNISGTFSLKELPKLFISKNLHSPTQGNIENFATRKIVISGG